METKMTKRDNIMQAVKFVCFSASAGVIQVVSFSIFDAIFKNITATGDFANWLFHSEYGVQYFLALVLSVIWNFTFNRKFTFKSANNIPIAMLKVFGYYCVFTPLSTWLGAVVTAHFNWGGDWHKYIVLGVTMLTNMATEFLFCRFVVYKNSMNTNDIALKDDAKKSGKTDVDG